MMMRECQPNQGIVAVVPNIQAPEIITNKDGTISARLDHYIYTEGSPPKSS